MTSALPPLHVGGDRHATDLHGRNFLKELDFTADEFLSLIDLSAFLKADKRAGCEVRRLTGKNIALIFEKTSTRTRAAFEVAAHDQGAHVTYLGPGETQLGRKESMVDTARVLGRMFDGIEYRGLWPGPGGRSRRICRRPGLERAHRSMAPDPDGGRHPDHAKSTAPSP
jgi:hypothetical protein